MPVAIGASMTKRRSTPNGRGHEQLGAAAPPPEHGDGPAMMDIVLPNGIDTDASEALGASAADSSIPTELAAGEGEIGNTLQTYLREIRRAPLFTTSRRGRR
jgi:RNA polymerase nonessential primary-like sigma factor